MDPSKLIDLLKTGGWQAAFLSVAGALFLYLSAIGIIPKLEAWMAIIAWIIILGGAALAVAAVAQPAQRLAATKMAERRQTIAIAAAERGFREYVPYLTEHERNILGYLLAHKQKTFTATADAGHGATLLGRGYIRILARRGQEVAFSDVPFEVVDYVWKAMEADPDKFRYEPEYSDGRVKVEVHPWRVAGW